MNRFALHILVGLTSTILAGFLSGCGETGGASQPTSNAQRIFSGNHPITVVCTTGMVADIVRNVGGPHVEVTQLMGEGTDPHLYKESPGDISLLAKADMIFFSGLHLEGKLGDIFVKMARDKPTFAVTESLDESRLLEVADGFFDPHIWFDVSLWSETVPFVAEELSKFDSLHTDDYQQNAAKYREELSQLHEFCRTEMAGIPPEQRVLVTAHDAFHYFGRAYDVTVKAIQGVSTETEAGLKQINDLVEFIVENEIKAVFIETSVNERNILALIEGCAQQNHTVAIGGELFSDAMGALGTEEGTYIGMVRHNVSTIKQALK